MKLTKKEAIKRHRELWAWLAENPLKKRTDWPGWEMYENIDSSCFLCEYAFESQKNDFNRLSVCDYCPVEFKETNGYPQGTVDYCLGGLFSRWNQAIEPKERSRIASLIRDLPEKVESKPEPKFKIGDIETPKYHAPKNYSCRNIVVNQYDRETIYNGPATICIINLGGKNYKGIAKCAPDDVFNERFGQGLAETRALIKAYKDLERRLIAKASQREG
jgi:hypothetical protein